MSSESDKQPRVKSSRAETSIGVGVALGVALGAAFGNVGLGLALGVAFGAAFANVTRARSKDREHRR
jgi:hypothetical protein